MNNKVLLGSILNEQTRELIVSSKDGTQTQQQNPESPALTLVRHATKYKVRKLRQRCILKKGCPLVLNGSGTRSVRDGNALGFVSCLCFAEHSLQHAARAHGLHRLPVLGAQKAIDEEVDGGVDVGEQLEDADHQVEGVVVPPVQAELRHRQNGHTQRQHRHGADDVED